MVEDDTQQRRGCERQDTRYLYRRLIVKETLFRDETD
jgi:hypothetical protein